MTKKNILILSAGIMLSTAVIIVVLGFSGVFTSEYTKYVRIAEDFRNNGSYERADIAYDNALEMNPKKTDEIKSLKIILYDMWTDNLFAEQDFSDKHLALLISLVEMQPKNVFFQLKKANLHTIRSEFDFADELYEYCIANFENEDAVYLSLCDYFLFRENRLSAVNVIKDGYEKLNSQKLFDKLSKIIPKAPVFSHSSGNYDEYINLEIKPDTDDKNNDFVVCYNFSNSSLDNPKDRIYDNLINFSDINDYETTYTISAVCIDKHGIPGFTATEIFNFNVHYLAVESISLLNEKDIALIEEQSIQLELKVYPFKANNKDVIWSVSDEFYAKVSETGLLTIEKFTENGIEKGEPDPAVKSEAYKKRRISEENIIVTCSLKNAPEIKYDYEITVKPYIVKPDEIDIETLEFKEHDIVTDYKKNNDTIGYIYMAKPESEYKDDTTKAIDIALVQTDNNEYYLDHNFNKYESSNGWIYLDCYSDITDEPNQNIVIYGHAKSYEALGGIKRMDVFPSWYNDANNHFIYLNTIYGKYIYQIYSWYETTDKDLINYETYRKQIFEDDIDFLDYCIRTENANKLPNMRKIGNFQPTDKILTFSTCKGVDDESRRVAVHAILVKFEPNDITEKLPGYVRKEIIPEVETVDITEFLD